MNYVQLAWIIPALPLGAMLISFLVLRPLDLASRNRGHAHVAETVEPGAEHAASHTQQELESTSRSAGAPGLPGGPEGPVGAHDIDTIQGAKGAGGALEHDAHATADDDHGGGHGDHGSGPLTPWAMASSILGTAAVAAAFIWSILILIQFLGDPNGLLKTGYERTIYDWFNFGNLNYPISYHVDGLTIVMLIVVTSVSALVHFYSIGYMAGDQGYARFFIELALFTLSMLILVLAANFLTIFIGWELVGLSSYLLIGFWFYDAPPPKDSDVPYPPPAQLKAFVTTRLGDFGMLIGILILFTQTQTFNFIELNTKTLNVNKGVMTVAMILIFCGAVGKSAQFPLHVWLPDAMAGPTPVSALIHAATMVAAGVYLVARLFPLYAVSAGPEALQVVGYIGAFTAFFAATIALVQNDIKGTLAYSTISQLGYVFAGLAVADTNAVGMYHLFTHAFFKALLFLGSGSVIHAIANQDMRKMGGLARFMPITAGTFLIATLSISGIPPFSGFWSKDPIIALAFEGHNYVIWAFTGVTAILTGFYMFRLYFLSFGGQGGKWAGFWGGRYRGEGHPHESPLVMWLPLALLAAATIVIGLAGFPPVKLNEGFAWFLNNGTNVTYAVAPKLDVLTVTGVTAGVVGILIAWAMYGVSVIPANALTRNPIGAGIYTLLKNKYYIDELYGFIVKYIVLGFGNVTVWIDTYIVDGVVNGSGRLVRGIGDITRRTETGEVQNYAAALFGGAMIILLVIFFFANGTFGK
ncbi:MAG: NADH-quinone oxidoreductase subunit L [Ktedonobacterales bacterium]